MLFETATSAWMMPDGFLKCMEENTQQTSCETGFEEEVKFIEYLIPKFVSAFFKHFLSCQNYNHFTGEEA